MSEAEEHYDAGKARRPDGWETTPEWVRKQLGAIWLHEAGCNAWGELVATFEGGQLKMIRVNRTIKP